MKTLGLILAAAWSLTGFGQGNNCSTAYDIPLDALCRNFAVSSTGASCDFCSYSGNTGKITYFRFTTDNSPQCVLLDVSASATVTMEMMLFNSCNAGNALPAGGLYNHGMCMDEGKGLWAQNLFDNLQANTTYYLRVRTQGGFTGNVQVCGKYYTPSNIICAGATPIGTIPVKDNNACQVPDPSVAPSQLCAITLENTAWYTYVIQNNGGSTITIDSIACNNGNGNNSNGFQIGFFNGSCGSLTPITCHTGAGGTVTATANGLSAGSRIYVAVDGYSGSNCSYRISASNAELLPVRLKEFSGWRAASKNILKWITVEEIDNGYFEIQRSADGRNYEPLAQVRGQESSVDETQYTYDDNAPPLRALYRLKQVDIDGDIKYSKVISISRSEMPFLDLMAVQSQYDQLNFTLRSSHKRKVQLNILDMQGRLLKTEWFNCTEGFTHHSKELPGLPIGQYYLVITHDREKITRPFIKSASSYKK